MDNREEGKVCPDCGSIVQLIEIECAGKKKREEPLETMLFCRCNHPGDTMCNCGNPCWTLF